MNPGGYRRDAICSTGFSLRNFWRSFWPCEHWRGARGALLTAAVRFEQGVSDLVRWVRESGEAVDRVDQATRELTKRGLAN